MTAPRDADARWRRTAASLSPAGETVAALVITHPDVTDPVRVVNNTVDIVIEGHLHQALRWEAVLVSDVEGEPPHAEIVMDNVGYELTRWIDEAQGGAGARVRIMEASLGEEVRVEWELALRVHSVTVDQARIRARLGYPALQDVPVVAVRHDGAHSPGLG